MTLAALFAALLGTIPYFYGGPSQWSTPQHLRKMSHRHPKFAKRRDLFPAISKNADFCQNGSTALARRTAWKHRQISPDMIDLLDAVIAGN